ncbi:MAG: hypothetical protein AAFZ63_18150, partial [Bacteroidota bacterium]
LILKAHHLLEKHTLGKWQLYWKEQLGNWYGMMVHEGQFLDPVMRDIEAFLTNSQERVSGEVFITLHPHRYVLDVAETGQGIALQGQDGIAISDLGPDIFWLALGNTGAPCLGRFFDQVADGFCVSNIASLRYANDNVH